MENLVQGCRLVLQIFCGLVVFQFLWFAETFDADVLLVKSLEMICAFSITYLYPKGGGLKNRCIGVQVVAFGVIGVGVVVLDSLSLYTSGDLNLLVICLYTIVTLTFLWIPLDALRKRNTWW